MTTRLDLPGSAAPRRSSWVLDAVLAPGVRWLAVPVLGASLVLPVSGLPVPLCALHAWTGLPCPGCGVTRALTAFSHGELATAVALHPFVLMLWPALVALAVLALTPRPWRERIERGARAHAGAGRAAELAVWAFVIFGVLRLAAFAAFGWSFP